MKSESLDAEISMLLHSVGQTPRRLEDKGWNFRRIVETEFENYFLYEKEEMLLAVRYSKNPGGEFTSYLPLISISK